MGFELTPRAEDLNARLSAFMDEHIYPRESDYDEFTNDHKNMWQYPEWFEDLKQEARSQGLWNLFLPAEYKPWSPGLTNLDFVRYGDIYYEVVKLVEPRLLFGQPEQSFEIQAECIRARDGLFNAS